MRKFCRFAVMSLLASAAIPIAASAQTVFMVQLGTFESEQQAAEQWKKLSSAFPEVFQTLQYTPGEVMMKPDNFVTYRTQAGPIATRGEAEAVCDIVAANGYECYVAETAMFYTNDTASGDIGFDESEEIEVGAAAVSQPAPAPQPVEPQTPVAVAQPVRQQYVQRDASQSSINLPNGYIPSTSPQYGGNGFVNNGASQTAPATTSVQGTGVMAVEEAIPVPLSEFSDPRQNPYLERGNRLMDAHPSDATRMNSFWAEISFFTNEQAAAQYVRVLKSRDPLLPAKLRIRITRPYGNVRGEQRLSLRIGPFLTTRPVRRLCGLVSQDRLRCRAVKDLGGSVRHEVRGSARQQPSQARAQTYADRRQQGFVSSSPMAGNAMTGSYYVQLGSFLSVNAAEDKWRELSASHSGLLGGAGKDIMSPMRGNNSSRLYRLRTGPFADHHAAMQMCNSLKAEGTLCIVVK